MECREEGGERKNAASCLSKQKLIQQKEQRNVLVHAAPSTPCEESLNRARARAPRLRPRPWFILKLLQPLLGIKQTIGEQSIVIKSPQDSYTGQFHLIHTVSPKHFKIELQHCEPLQNCRRQERNQPHSEQTRDFTGLGSKEIWMH